MKRFYLAVPVEYEEKTIRRIGEMGAVQLTREIPLEGDQKTETVEICTRFMQLYERMNSLLPKMAEKSILSVAAGEPDETILDQIRVFVKDIEPRLDEAIKLWEKTESEIDSFRAIEKRLGFLKSYGLRVDEIGKFGHIFVKAGFLNNVFLSKLTAYLGGTSVVYSSKPGRPKESFVVVTGLNEDLPFAEDTLKLLNFDELTFPQAISSEPKQALDEIKSKVSDKEKEAGEFKESLSEMRVKFDIFEPYVSNILQVEEAKGFIVRTKKRSLIQGWIPSDKTQLLKTQIDGAVQKESIYLKFENPTPEDDVPVKLQSKGLLGSFGMFTYLQGIPNYFETDPTPIYVILFLIMFGMMFGDVGLGGVFVVLGLLLTRMRKGLLVFSQSVTNKLGQIVISCGVSSVFFGVLYATFFLVEKPFGMNPILPSPLKDINEIIVIALSFGVLQIILALTLNIANRLRRKETLKAVFSGHGVVGLTYYLAGVVLGIAFIRENGFGAFILRSVIPFTVIAVVSLGLVFASPIIRTLLERKQGKLSEKLMEGFGELLETLIAFIANSISYIRLAAFAIAHAALGLAAVIFASIVGNVPSLILMNIIVFLVEGFAAFIQSLRLMYYEFSTKFYAGDGTSYEPFKLTPAKKT